jgi:hypothetical protein
VAVVSIVKDLPAEMRADVSGVPVLPFEHDVIFLIMAF